MADLSMDFVREFKLEEIPIVVHTIEGVIKDEGVTETHIDSTIATFWSLLRTYKEWIEPYMRGDWDGDTIRIMGSYLLMIENGIINASDEFYKTKNIRETIGFMWPVIAYMKDAWNRMDNMGLMNVIPIIDEDEL